MEYGETCIPGRMDDLPTILTVADVKLSCDESHGYPNRSFWAFFFTSFQITRMLWNLKFVLNTGVGRTCLLDRICSRSTASSVWDTDMGLFASCRYWSNLVCRVGPGSVIFQSWPGGPPNFFVAHDLFRPWRFYIFLSISEWSKIFSRRIWILRPKIIQNWCIWSLH